MKFFSQKEAISAFSGIAQDKIIKVSVGGIENDGIYKVEDKNYKISLRKDKIKVSIAVGSNENDGFYKAEDKIYKISNSRKEFDAAKRLIGKNFKNVVKVYSANECLILSTNNNFWVSFVIEMEKLTRAGNEFVYKNLDLDTLNLDVKKRIPYMIDVLNGVLELESLGIKHEDLHTMNIMRDKDGNQKIIDFGIISLKRKYDNKIKFKLFIKENV